MDKRKQRSAAEEEELFEIDYIKGRKLIDGHPQYLIKWKGDPDDKDNTWEPLSNLAGIERDVAAYEAKKRQEALDFAAALREKHKAKRSAPAASASSGTPTTWDDVVHDLEAEGETTSGAATEESMNGRRSAPIWARFKLDTCADAKLNRHHVCQEIVGQGDQAKICGIVLSATTGPTSLWNHHQGKHKSVYQELKGWLDPATADPGVSITDALQRTIAAARFSDARKAECDLSCARWLVKSVRPISLPDTDNGFRDFIKTLTRDAGTPPNRRNVMDNILKLSAQGQLLVQGWFDGMVIDGVKPSIAGDIWSHKGCSIMGICMYGISSSWVINEWIVAATPFGATRHTGDTIDDITVAALKLKQQGIKWRENGSVYEAVHGKVSDNASNMVITRFSGQG
jgi:hypothetical protein